MPAHPGLVRRTAPGTRTRTLGVRVRRRVRADTRDQGAEVREARSPPDHGSRTSTPSVPRGLLVGLGQLDQDPLRQDAAALVAGALGLYPGVNDHIGGAPGAPV